MLDRLGRLDESCLRCCRIIMYRCYWQNSLYLCSHVFSRKQRCCLHTPSKLHGRWCWEADSATRKDSPRMLCSVHCAKGVCCLRLSPGAAFVTFALIQRFLGLLFQDFASLSCMDRLAPVATWTQVLVWFFLVGQRTYLHIVPSHRIQRKGRHWCSYRHPSSLD